MTAHSNIQSVLSLGLAGMLLLAFVSGAARGEAKGQADKNKTAGILAAKVKAMLASAKAELAGLEVLQQTRRGGMDPESLNLKQVCGRKILEAELILADTPNQKIVAIRRHVAFCQAVLTRTKGRRHIDADIVQVMMAEYALIEAKYMLAGVSERGGEANKKAGAMKMLAAAEKAAKGLDILQKTRRGGMDPEFLNLKQVWTRRVMEAELLLANTPDQRIAVIRRYVAVRQAELVMIERRKDLDVGTVQIMMAQYTLAEAQYMLAGVLERSGAADKKAAAKKMQAAAEKAVKAMDAPQETRKGGTDPGFLNLKQFWIRRVMEAELLLANTPEQRIVVIRRYVAVCKNYLKMIKSRNNLDAGIVQIKMAEYALAEAQYMLAEQEAVKASS